MTCFCCKIIQKLTFSWTLGLLMRFLGKNCSKTCQLPLFNLFCSQSYASDISAMKLNKNGKPNCFKFKWARRACTYGANTDVISFQKKEWEVLITHEKYAQSNHGQAFWRFYILLFFCINQQDKEAIIWASSGTLFNYH